MTRPSRGSGYQVGGFACGAPGGVDAQGVEKGVIESLGVRHCLLGYLGQVSCRLSAQRVSRLRPAASFAPADDPPPQFGGFGVQAACRDHRSRQRGLVGGEHELVLNRAGHHQVRGPGSVEGPPDTREIAGLEPVATEITMRSRSEEPDLVQVDVARGEAGPQAPLVHLEADRRLAHPRRPVQQHDLAAAARCLAPGRTAPGRQCPAGLPAGHPEAGPVAAAVLDQPGHLAGPQAGRVHAHVGELAGVHAVTIVPDLPH